MMTKGTLSMVQRTLDIAKRLAYMHARITTFLHYKIMITVPVMTPTRRLEVDIPLCLIQNATALDMLELAVPLETQFMIPGKVIS